MGSPHAPHGLRYLSLVTMPDGRQRVYYEATRADGATTCARSSPTETCESRVTKIEPGSRTLIDLP